MSTESPGVTVLPVDEFPHRNRRRKSLGSRDPREQVRLSRVLVDQESRIEQQQVRGDGCFEREEVRHTWRMSLSADAGNWRKAGAVGQSLLQALHFVPKSIRLGLERFAGRDQRVE